MRSQPIFRPSVFANHVFTTKEVNHAKKRVFQANVFNTQRAFTPHYVIPAVFSGTFNFNTFQSSWALKDTTTENVAITPLTPNTVMGKVKTIVLEIINLAETNIRTRGRYGFANESVGVDELLSRVRAVARSIEEGLVVSHFTGSVRDVARTIAEGLAIDELISNGRVLARTLASSIEMAESQMQRLVKSHTLSSNIAISEANYRFRKLVRMLNHDIGITETFPRILNKVHSIAETVNILLIDTFANHVFNNSVFQTITEVVRTRGRYGFANESLAISEANDRFRALMRILTFDVDVSEANDRVRSMARTLTEDLVISHFNGRVRDLARTLAEGLSISEVNDRFRALARTLSFNIDVAESQMQRLTKIYVLAFNVGISEVNDRVRSITIQW